MKTISQYLQSTKDKVKSITADEWGGLVSFIMGLWLIYFQTRDLQSAIRFSIGAAVVFVIGGISGFVEDSSSQKRLFKIVRIISIVLLIWMAVYYVFFGLDS